MARRSRSGTGARRRRGRAAGSARRSARGRSAGRAGARCGAGTRATSGSASSASMAAAGSSVGATISMSPTVSCAAAQRADRHRPRDARHAAEPTSIGSASAAARPSGIAGTRARSAGSAAAIAASTAASRPGSARIGLLADRGARGRPPTSTPSALMERGELLDRDGARLEQPAQIGGQVGDRRLDQHPAAGLVHLAEPLEHLGVGAGGRILEERPEVGVGVDAVATRRAPRRPRTAPLGARRRESSRATRAARACGGGKRPRAREDSQEIDGLAFQCAGFGRRLLGRFLRFGRQIGGEPVGDAALERDGAIALADQLGRDVRAGQLVRIRVVDDDLAIARQRRRRTVAR